MVKARSLNAIKKALLNKMSTTSGILISLMTILGMGFVAGNYYQIVISNGEISDLKNKHSIEMLELYNTHAEKIMDYKSEIIELQRKISLLEIENEESKK